MLLFLILNLIFGDIFFFKKLQKSLNILRFRLKQNRLYAFLFLFLNYLPLSNIVAEKLYKSILHGIILSKNSTISVGVNFFSFPPISELDKFYEDFENFYLLVSSFKLQCIFSLSICNEFSSINFLLRFFKFPCRIFLS